MKIESLIIVFLNLIFFFVVRSSLLAYASAKRSVEARKLFFSVCARSQSFSLPVGKAGLVITFIFL